MVTRPVAVPGSDPIREIGLMLRELGACCGATVIFTCWLTPPADTVIVAAVACVTAEVVTGIDHDHEPALTAAGETWTDFSAVGSTVIWSETDTPLSVAVIVTGVGTATCPSEIWKSVQAWVPGIVIVAGTGTTEGFELVRLTVAPLAA